jgi:histidinol-phosphate aminotransferase
VRTFCTPGDEVLAPAQSFACYRLAAQMHGMAYVEVPRGENFAYRLDALVDAVTPRTKVVFLANPDNPTGVYATREELTRLVSRLPERIILALDEAYFEFATAADYPDGLRLRGERPLLVSLRTFSKIYGLAGLRCGYAVGPREVVEYLNRVRNPFNVNSLAQAAAHAALDDTEHVTRSRALNIEGMAQVTAGLTRLGLSYVPSQTNFVLVDVAPLDGRALFSALLRQGVIVRPMSGYQMPRHVRVSIGTFEENRRFLAAVPEALHELRASA